MKISEITDTNSMIRHINRQMMVRWINRDLIRRANHDVRKSIVLYDEHKAFMSAMLGVPALLVVEDDGVAADSLRRLGVRFWSKGIV